MARHHSLRMQQHREAHAPGEPALTETTEQGSEPEVSHWRLSEQDITLLARKVYLLLCQELRQERERTG